MHQQDGSMLTDVPQLLSTPKTTCDYQTLRMWNRHSLRGPVDVLQVRNIPEATWDQQGPKDQIKDRKENRVRALSSQKPRGAATGQYSPETTGHTALQTP